MAGGFFNYILTSLSMNLVGSFGSGYLMIWVLLVIFSIAHINISAMIAMPKNR